MLNGAAADNDRGSVILSPPRPVEEGRCKIRKIGHGIIQRIQRAGHGVIRKKLAEAVAAQQQDIGRQEGLPGPAVDIFQLSEAQVA